MTPLAQRFLSTYEIAILAFFRFDRKIEFPLRELMSPIANLRTTNTSRPTNHGFDSRPRLNLLIINGLCYHVPRNSEKSDLHRNFLILSVMRSEIGHALNALIDPRLIVIVSLTLQFTLMRPVLSERVLIFPSIGRCRQTRIVPTCWTRNPAPKKSPESGLVRT